jgi:macrolide-specific efflux system membrane fusion protein
LVEKGAATAQALEQSQSDLKSAQATLTSISAQIEKTEQTLVSDQADLNHTAITAPISGLVISPTSSVYGTTWTKQDIAHQGQILNNKSNAPILLRLANLDNMIVRAQVSEADVAKLRTGMPTYFTTLGRPNRRVSGKLDTIEPTPELINGAIFYDALFQVANPDHKLLPQMTAQVFFVVGQASDAVTVPITALASAQRQSGVVLAGCPSTAANTQTAHAHQHARNEQGPVATTTLDCVFVLDNGKPLAREVTVGLKNEVDAQITSGLDAGTQVIVGVPAAQHEPNRGNGQGRKQ